MMQQLINQNNDIQGMGQLLFFFRIQTSAVVEENMVIPLKNDINSRQMRAMDAP